MDNRAAPTTNQTADGRSIDWPTATTQPMADLYQREHRTMLRLAALMVGSASMAEEIVHDAFVVAGQRWGQVQNPGGYLRQVVINASRQALRRRKSEDRAHCQVADHANLVEHLPAHLIELNDALATLTDRQRTVIVLRYFIDLPDREIATVLGARPATVRSLARRALGSLRKELA